MQKIMFDDRFGLTKAVLEGRKTMTRRIARAWSRTDGSLSGWMPSKYKAGDVVAVAQNYASVYGEGILKDGRYDSYREIYGEAPGWSNKMFVRAELMPHKIRIKNVRVERLQDITSEDALREGIYCDYENLQYSYPTEIGYCGQYPFGTARDAFADLIDRVSGKGTWESNPWVFVYDFELVK